MGSLSWLPVPSRSDLIITTMNILTLVLICCCMVPSLCLLSGSRSAVKYLGDTFLLPDGCPSEDPVVQRFYKLCLETRGGDTLCTTDRFPNGRSLTIPAFSNICSTICHNMPEDGMKICPYKGKVLDFSFDNQELNRLEATNSNTFQRRFSFGK